jgi:hypothetical protein
LYLRKDLSTRYRVDLLTNLQCKRVEAWRPAMIAVETLYLSALLIAFVGLIALIVLAASANGSSSRSFLGNIVIVAAIASLGSFLFYAFSARDEARSVYGAANVRYLRL